MSESITQAAYQMLARREQSAKELQIKLASKGFDADEIAQTLLKLQQANLQSDQRFGEMIMRNRVNKGYGWLYIRQELGQKGLSEQIINELDKNHEIDWYLQAELAYNRRFKKQPVDAKDKAKRLRFLQYRGFTIEQAFYAFENKTEL